MILMLPLDILNKTVVLLLKRILSDFRNDGFYFDLPSIKKAYQYLEGDHINSLKELQENFQKNFIDNFIEGESIFFVSW